MTEELKHSLNVLKKHGLLLYPTDTIWGIGCDATNEEAVAKVYKLKQREESKALICLVSDIETLKTYVQDIPETVLELLFQAKRPTTIIYNNPILLANNLIANDNTIAVRLVSDGFAHELIKEFKKPIVSTSANISGMPAPKSFKEIHPDILKGVDYVVNLHDEKVDARPSTIIKLNLDGKIEVIRE